MAPGESLISPYQRHGHARLLRGAEHSAQTRPLLHRQRHEHVAAGRDRRRALAKKFWHGQDPVGRRMWKPREPRGLHEARAQEPRGSPSSASSANEDGRAGRAPRRGRHVLLPVRAGRHPRTMTLAVRTAGDPLAVTGAFAQELARDRSGAAALQRADDGGPHRRVADRPPHADAARRRCSAASRCSSPRSASTACSPTRWRSGGRRSGSAWRSAASRAASSGWSCGKGCAAGRRPRRRPRGRVRDPAGDGDAAVRRQPMDPLVLAAVAGVLGVVAFIACAVPARRAARIDPRTALSES